jgi:hypothetical protein
MRRLPASEDLEGANEAANRSRSPDRSPAMEVGARIALVLPHGHCQGSLRLRVARPKRK